MTKITVSSGLMAVLFAHLVSCERGEEGTLVPLQDGREAILLIGYERWLVYYHRGERMESETKMPLSDGDVARLMKDLALARELRVGEKMVSCCS